MKDAKNANMEAGKKHKTAKKPIPAKKTTKPAKSKKAAKPPASNKKVTSHVKKINCQLPGAELLAEGKSVAEVMEALDNDKKGMKAEHERFCLEYILDDNATRAYQRAYPNCSYDAAKANGYKLLTKACIKQRVTELRTERNKRLEISADKVLRRLEARASVTPRDLYNPDGSFIPIHELHPDVAIGIKSIEVVELFDGKGEERTAIGLVRKITLNDGKASDELLGKNLALWKEVGSEQNPLTVKQFEVVFGCED